VEMKLAPFTSEEVPRAVVLCCTGVEERVVRRSAAKRVETHPVPEGAVRR